MLWLGKNTATARLTTKQDRLGGCIATLLSPNVPPVAPISQRKLKIRNQEILSDIVSGDFLLGQRNNSGSGGTILCWMVVREQGSTICLCFKNVFPPHGSMTLIQNLLIKRTVSCFHFISLRTKAATDYCHTNPSGLCFSFSFVRKIVSVTHL